MALWVNPADAAGYPGSVVTALAAGIVNIYAGPVPASGATPLSAANALVATVALAGSLYASGSFLGVAGLPYGYGTLAAYNGMPTTFFRAVDGGGTVHLQGTTGFGAGALWTPSSPVNAGVFVEALGHVWECARPGVTGRAFPSWSLPTLPAPYIQLGALVGTLPIGFPNIVGTWQQPTWQLLDGEVTWLWCNALPDLMLNRNNVQQNSIVVLLNGLLPASAEFPVHPGVLLDGYGNPILDGYGNYILVAA